MKKIKKEGCSIEKQSVNYQSFMVNHYVEIVRQQSVINIPRACVTQEVQKKNVINFDKKKSKRETEKLVEGGSASGYKR